VQGSTFVANIPSAQPPTPSTEWTEFEGEQFIIDGLSRREFAHAVSNQLTSSIGIMYHDITPCCLSPGKTAGRAFELLDTTHRMELVEKIFRKKGVKLLELQRENTKLDCGATFSGKTFEELSDSGRQYLVERATKSVLDERHFLLDTTEGRWCHFLAYMCGWFMVVICWLVVLATRPGDDKEPSTAHSGQSGYGTYYGDYDDDPSYNQKSGTYVGFLVGGIMGPLCMLIYFHYSLFTEYGYFSLVLSLPSLCEH
jgi:hypothetical protein